MLAEKVFNQDEYFKRTVKIRRRTMTHLESIASSAVRAALKVKASVIICFTSSEGRLGKATKENIEYSKKTSPDVDDALHSNLQALLDSSELTNGFFILQAESTNATNESVLKVALDHGKASGIVKSHDRVVVCQKVGDASVVKIIELEDLNTDRRCFHVISVES
ncbi:Pyruvate kinase, cytosolic [Sesamum angolense]|uniref:Pyruvate kinase, cytosolic n=1 Tax=Sesamum angolense TaxID=2727404 RepID=A0AAE1WNM4_9LAMI|nr:Pyruvate kinase, cytosolic [Sesamum angolense]